jgi:hypothetical protein
LPNIALNFIKTIVMVYRMRQIIKTLFQDVNFLSRQPKSTILCDF